MDDSKRRLIWHGMFLFLLGLLTGFVETKFANPANGAGGASGRRDERDVSYCAGCGVDGGATAAEVEGRSLLVRALWRLRELGSYLAGSGFGRSSTFADYRRGTPRAALARNIDDRIVYVGRAGNCRGVDTRAVGIAAQRRCCGVT